MGHDKHRRHSSSSTSSSGSSSDSSSESGNESTVVSTPIVVAAKSKPEKSSSSRKRRHSVTDSSSDSDSNCSSERQHKKSKSSSSKHRASTGETETASKKHKKQKTDKLSVVDEGSKSPSVLPPPADLTPRTAVKQEELKEASGQKSSGAAVGDVTSASLFAEVVCEFADFATNLAQRISQKAGYSWTPQVVREAKGAGKSKEPKLKEPKDPNEPRRPCSSYTLWSNHIRKKIKEQQPDRPSLKMVELSELWKQVPQEQKAKWEQAARVERDQYAKELEAYNRTKAQNNSNEVNGK